MYVRLGALMISDEYELLLGQRIVAAFIIVAMFSHSVAVFNGSFWKAAIVFAVAMPICCMGTMRRWFQPLAIIAFTLAMGVWLQFLPPALEWRQTLVASLRF